MIPDLVLKIKKDINEFGHVRQDNRLKRTVREIPGYRFLHYYLNPVEKPTVLDKYKEDWKRMYLSFKQACYQVKLDPQTRRAMLFNDTKFTTNYQCFPMMQVLEFADKEYGLIVYQRSCDLDKIEDDVNFYEYVMYKISKQIEIPVNRLLMFFGSIHHNV